MLENHLLLNTYEWNSIDKQVGGVVESRRRKHVRLSTGLYFIESFYFSNFSASRFCGTPPKKSATYRH